ncbi:MAG TPA: hypothetical protein VMM18_00625 [Gemmatimonadaceae bacterium]|nr:hypothetical protein [Gemmatimonadaceae bacterium]
MRHSGTGALAATGFIGGVLLGLVVWNGQLQRHRGDLFSSRPVRRWVALSYLGTRPTIENCRLLRDYLAWERRPSLKRRGEIMLRRMEQVLE